MKTKCCIAVNTVSRIIVFIAFCMGVTSSQALEGATATKSSTQTPQTKAQLHLPWNLLSERLTSFGNNHDAIVENPVDNIVIEAQGLNWNLSSGMISANVSIDQAIVTETLVNLSGAKIQLKARIPQVAVDQVVERVISGVRVRVHVNAVCGPIELTQNQLNAGASFQVDWSSGSPRAQISKLEIGWAPESWVLNEFSCSGPSGLDQELKDGIVQALRDPQMMRDYFRTYIGENLQSKIDSVMVSLRNPLELKSGSTAVNMIVGELTPVATGIIVDITVKSKNEAALASAPKAVPADAVLQNLSLTQPSFIADIKTLEFAVSENLKSQPNYFQVNLQTLSGFQKLMQSRLTQLFVWNDLWNFPKANPFYLNLKNPRALTLVRGADTKSFSLNSSLPLQSVLQAYRADAWWTYVNTQGTAQAKLSLSLANGNLNYATTIESVSMKSAYGEAYRTRFNKGSGSIPDEVISGALVGPQAALSGTVVLPDVDLGIAGSYRAGSLSWIDSKTFSISFKMRP